MEEVPELEEAPEPLPITAVLLEEAPKVEEAPEFVSSMPVLNNFLKSM